MRLDSQPIQGFGLLLVIKKAIALGFYVGCFRVEGFRAAGFLD